LWERVAQFAKLASSGGTKSLPEPRSAIVPAPVGDEREAVALADRLREQGLGIPAVRYPAVPRGKARLRMTLTAAHSAEDIARAAGALEALGLFRHS
jgi:7-keto-8-aminopelargonate synthetase-like enzyme